MKQMATAVVALVALVVVGGAVAAQGGPDIETLSPSFVLTSATCPNLPPGTTITAPEGSGTGKSITSESTDGNGVTTLMNTTHEFGTAWDQDGNAYVYQYANSFRVSDSASSPGVFNGQMTDHFSLSGPGPATLSNGFVATISTDFFSFFMFDRIASHGDPISFPDGEELCDPL